MVILLNLYKNGNIYESKDKSINWFRKEKGKHIKKIMKWE